MPISVVTRSYRTSELRNLVSYLEQNNETEKEVIAVCNRNDYDLHGIKLVLEGSNRFKARITGIRNAQYDRILLLDSDQVPEDGLLSELSNVNEDMVIVPERSLSGSLTAECLDDWRIKNEKLARMKTSPYMLVVPRFYKREPLLDTISKLSNDIYNILSHEDSILYYEVFKSTHNIGFSRRYIYNKDPDFITLLRKAYLYGKFKKSAEMSNAPSDIIYLLNKLNRNVLNIKELGLGKGYLVQIPRGILYELGTIFPTKLIST